MFAINEMSSLKLMTALFILLSNESERMVPNKRILMIFFIKLHVKAAATLQSECNQGEEIMNILKSSL